MKKNITVKFIVYSVKNEIQKEMQHFLSDKGIMLLGFNTFYIDVQRVTGIVGQEGLRILDRVALQFTSPIAFVLGR